MGVMECWRNGYENIMCDRYNSKYGYICHECFEELVTVWKNKGTIQEFMNSEKVERIPEIDFYEFYDKIFPSE